MLARGPWMGLCKYSSVKTVRVQSVGYGSVRWVTALGVLVYICFGLFGEKLYQRKETLISSVHTKVKGQAEVTMGNKTEVLDTVDYMFFFQGNSFSVMTNFRITEGQTQGVCPEFPTSRTVCSSHQDCEKGIPGPLSKGIKTGRCVTYNATHKTCEVSAWCPVEPEADAPWPALLASAENFTVLIKNSIHFPGHNYSTGNIQRELNSSCRYHKTRNPQCPIFRLGDIVQEAGENFSDMAVQGGIIGINIEWQCNLDTWSHHCQPQYSFQRLDGKIKKEPLYPDSKKMTSVLSGSARHAKYYKSGNTEKRNLLKMYRIRFDVLVFGKGGKFNIIQLIVFIGSTLSYCSLSLVIIKFLTNTYSKAFCRSWVYPFCKICEPCAVNEYYFQKTYETIMEPKSTLKCVSFVDESHIRMMDQGVLEKSLQYMEGKKIPKPQGDFKDVAKLSLLSHPDASPGCASPEEMQLLNQEPRLPLQARPEWCRCGHCRPSQLTGSSKFIEELCCCREEGPCITTSALFEVLVLSRATLHFILLYQEPLLEMDGEGLNDRLRYCAYRRYIDWRFGSEDIASFAILPSCCRWKIREHFPKDSGQYSGFKNPSLYKQT